MSWDNLIDNLVPICICVVLPIIVVWLNLRAKMNETNRKAEVMLKAIEAGKDVDANYFKQEEKVKTVKGQLLGKLTGACVSFFIGALVLTLGLVYLASGKLDSDEAMLLLLPGSILIAVGTALFISFFVGRRMLAKEIAAEEERLTENRQQ